VGGGCGRVLTASSLLSSSANSNSNMTSDNDIAESMLTFPGDAALRFVRHVCAVPDASCMMGLPDLLTVLSPGAGEGDDDGGGSCAAEFCTPSPFMGVADTSRGATSFSVSPDAALTERDAGGVV